jgi:hypothetical protein
MFVIKGFVWNIVAINHIYQNLNILCHDKIKHSIDDSFSNAEIAWTELQTALIVPPLPQGRLDYGHVLAQYNGLVPLSISRVLRPVVVDYSVGVLRNSASTVTLDLYVREGSGGQRQLHGFVRDLHLGHECPMRTTSQEHLQAQTLTRFLQ